MGAGGSKAAGRAYQAAGRAAGTPSAAAAASEAAEAAAQHGVPPAAGGALARDAAAAEHLARLRAVRTAPSLEEEEKLEGRDASLDELLSKLGGSITGTRVLVSPTQEALQRQAAPAAGPSEKGRLPPDALRLLFILQAEAQGSAVDLTRHDLIAKHKPSQELVERVLQHACLPSTMEAQGPAGVGVFADWPNWFRRRGGSG